MKTGVTCLVPFYNEGQRLINTLNKITSIKSIDKIICIDDGSSDNCSAIVEKKFSNVKLIRISRNLGKTEAIRHGLQLLKTPYILLLDADLVNLVANEIQDAINIAVNKPLIDMIILQRVNEPFMVKLWRFDTILSGQRIIKTQHLKIILQGNISHYDLEVAMNDYAIKNHLHILRLPISAVNSRRLDKWGMKRSFLTNVSMFSRFMKYPGLATMFKQILYFAKD